MSNAIATPTVFAKTGLALLKNNLVAARKVSGQMSKEFRKVGETVKAKRHPEFTVGTGRVASSQDVLEGEVTVTLNTQKHVAFKFNSVEETLSVDSLLKSKSMDAAMAQLAQTVDSDILATAYKGTYSWAGTLGQTINSAADFFKGPERLTKMAVPMNDRHAILYPTDAYALAGSFTGGTSTSIPGEIARAAIERATIPMIADVSPVMSQSVPTHTPGNWTGGALVKGASQSVAYTTAAVRNSFAQGLLIDDLSNGATVKVGDVFTFTDVYAVNPRTKEVQDYLQQFTVVAGTDGSGGYVDSTETYTYSTGGSNEMTIQISPPIIISGAFQTVNKAPDNDSAITVVSSAAAVQNLCFHREAFALCTAPLVLPFSGEADIATDPDTGLSIRYWRYSDGTNDEHAHRFDILYGVTVLDPRLATRLSGTA